MPFILKQIYIIIVITASEDTMAKIVAIHIGNINDTFIGIFMGMPLGYIVCYHHAYDYYVMKNKEDISR